MTAIVLATHNLDKLEEIKPFFPNTRLYTLHDFDLSPPEEVGKTYIENALLKARFAAEKTKLPTIADDSGLEIDYLNQAPGILSARFGGVQGVEKVLRLLKGVPWEKRTARFRSVLVWLRSFDDPYPRIGLGTCSGWVTEEVRGENGFGYDPIFYLAEYKKTIAQLPASIKQQISHRTKALTDLFRVV